FGIDPDLLQQFPLLEESLQAAGFVVWPMVEFEADDALAAGAEAAARDERVEQIVICTPDKDLAQCVRGDRVVQVDRRSKAVRDAAQVQAKFGVNPELIPDYLALVGDSADGYPGIKGIGAKGAASLIARYHEIERFPPEVLGDHRALALLFKKLATLRTDAKLYASVEELEWRGPTAEFSPLCERLGAPNLVVRAKRAAELAKTQR
ncbi:MAG: flap endonuclease, partial [Candidatus Eremiobacteraeota bacterium]|nr:flap endonuclease [Candidatus Eremiobacteraeota bacterium]